MGVNRKNGKLLTSFLCTKKRQATGHKAAARAHAADVAGTFYKVSLCGVLHKAERHGLQRSLIQWLKTYLANRRIRAVMNGQRFAMHEIPPIGPQGTILGPTLFSSMSMTPKTTCLRQSGSRSMQMTWLYIRQSWIGRVQQLTLDSCGLQTAVDSLATWGTSWHIAFEATKSQVLTISP